MYFSLNTIAAAALIFASAEAFPHRPHGTGSGHSGQAHGTGLGRPQGSGRPQGTGVPSAFPSGASFNTNALGGGRNSTGGGGGKGKGRFTRLPSGSFPSGFPTDGAPFPSGALPSEGFPSGGSGSAIPSGPAPTEAPALSSGLPDISSISFELPGTAANNAVNAAAEKSTKTKSKSTKTSAAAEETATDSGDSDSTTTAAESTAETTTAATQSDSSDDEAVATSAIASATESSSGDDEAVATSAAASVPAATSGTATTPTGSSNSSSGSTSATTTFPEAAGESTLSEAMTVTGSFDGGMVRFGRGVECGGQTEGGDSDAVFIVEEGGSLSNVIIGADQGEGVHCTGSCTITNVWWEAVCEDAFTIKKQSDSGTSYIIGGGAKGASDKVLQHNGGGTLSVKGFYVSDFGKLYRSCGNCDTMVERHVILDGIVADGGSATLVGINTNYGDTATITNSCITNTDTICTEFEGNDTGDEPTEVSTGISASCIYTQADVSAC